MELLRRKNIASHFVTPMIDSTTPASFKTGETVTATIYARDVGDSAGYADVTPSAGVTVTEIGSSGLYEFDLDTTEMNYDTIVVKLTAANSADTSLLINTYVPQNVISSEILADIVEGSLTVTEVYRLLLSFVSGISTGGGTTEITFKSADGLTDRIVMTVDTNGNRSVVAVDGS